MVLQALTALPASNTGGAHARIDSGALIDRTGLWQSLHCRMRPQGRTELRRRAPPLQCRSARPGAPRPSRGACCPARTCRRMLCCPVRPRSSRSRHHMFLPSSPPPSWRCRGSGRCTTVVCIWLFVGEKLCGTGSTCRPAYSLGWWASCFRKAVQLLILLVLIKQVVCLLHVLVPD